MLEKDRRTGEVKAPLRSIVYEMDMMHTKLKPKSKGFSLVELLVVMAIISILAVFGVTSYMKYIANAKYAKMEAALRQMATVAEDVYNEFQQYPSGICDALLNIHTISCSVNSALTVVLGTSGVYTFKVPAKMKVTFNPQGVNAVQITLESALLKASTSGNAKLVFDSRMGEIVCYDDQIHGVQWAGCP